MNNYNGWGDGYFLWLGKLAMFIVERGKRALLSLPLVKRVALLPPCVNNKTIVCKISWV